MSWALIRRLIWPGDVFLAWLQLVFEGKRLLAAICGIIFVVLSTLFQLAVYRALFEGVVAPYRFLKADIVLYSPDHLNIAQTTSFREERLAMVYANPAVESTARVTLDFGFWTHPTLKKRVDGIILAVDPSEDPFLPSMMADHLEDLRVQDAILYDSAAEARFGPITELKKSHDPFYGYLNGARVRVGRDFKIGSSFLCSGTFVTSLLNLRRFATYKTDGKITLGLVRLKPGSDAKAVAAQIAATLPSDVKCTTFDQFIENEITYCRTFTPVGYVVPVSLIVSLIVGMVVIYQILFTNVADHLREYATLKAMGFSHRDLAAVVMQQGFILSLLGFPPGLLVSLLLMKFSRMITGMPFNVSIPQILLAMILTMAICFAAGYLALQKLKQADPADVFA